MPTYSADAIRSGLSALPDDDSFALAAKGKGPKLAATPSSDLHDLHAAAYDAATNGAFSAALAKGDGAKVVQIVLSLHGPVQGSELNARRGTYRGRTAASLRKGAETLQENLSAVPGELPGAKARRARIAAAKATTAPTAKRGRKVPAKATPATAAKSTPAPAPVVAATPAAK